MTTPEWLKIARELHTITQVGLEYAKDGYDTDRYERLRKIAVDIIEKQSTLSAEEIEANFAMQPGYITPKVDVRAAVIRDGKILLVQEQSDGRWALPGGWADVGDTPSQAAIREVWEESGFKVRAESVVGVYDANRVKRPESLPYYHAYKLLFLCSITGGEATPSHETLAVDFFAPDDLPPLSKYRTPEKIIADAFAHHAAQNRQTLFD